MKIYQPPYGLLILGLCILLTSSCVSRKEMVYFQEIDKLGKSANRDKSNNLEIQPDDVLTIRVSAPEQEAAIPFNLTKSMASQMDIRGNVELETYMVSDEGSIEFPVIGTVEVTGFTSIELAKKLQDQIAEYVQDPIVNVRILNFQISVMGEVNNPGTFTIQDDHISLAKALAMAGDITLWGKRNNILILGEEDGIKTYAYLDLTKADVLHSPHYNLRQNDVVYVEPKAARRQSASPVGVASTFLSLASVVASLVILLTR